VIVSIEELPGLLAEGGTLAGLDLGDKTIGVAVSDRSLAFAHPRPVIARKKFTTDAAALLRALGKDDVRAIAIGLPLNMDGSEGPRCQAVRAFAQNLDAALGLPILLWDERLTTFAAEEAAERAGLRGKERADMLDALAAAALLQDVLNTLAGRRLDQDPQSSAGG
jgi:putative holliday junction resolvase